MKIVQVTCLICFAKCTGGARNTVFYNFSAFTFIFVHSLSFLDDASILEVLSTCEKVALQLANEGNIKSCLLWYDIIVQYASHHGTFLN